jgi:hypothetical protein
LAHWHEACDDHDAAYRAVLCERLTMAVDPQLLAYYAAVAQRFAALPEPADMAAQR